MHEPESPEIPRLCHDLTGIGGIIKQTPEDFRVEEVPQYTPCGEGQHIYLDIEKTGVSAGDLSQWLSASGFREIGMAGRKDKQAVTRQWVSVERARWEAKPPVPPEGIRILSATPHKNKLKTGHLRGNRFTVLIREARNDRETVEAVIARLKIFGLPNYFGAQRFGFGGRNVADGLRVMRGEIRLPRNKGQFLISALQSDLFNRLLARRLNEGTWRTVLPGDVLKKTDSGGLFQTEDPAADQPRLDSGELAITGPLFGPEMPPAAAAALALEGEILAAAGLTPDDFAKSRVPTTGGRRFLSVVPEDLDVLWEGDKTLRLSFFLPKGSYATILLREFMGDAGLQSELE